MATTVQANVYWQPALDEAILQTGLFATPTALTAELVAFSNLTSSWTWQAVASAPWRAQISWGMEQTISHRSRTRQGAFGTAHGTFVHASLCFVILVMSMYAVGGSVTREPASMQFMFLLKHPYFPF